MMGPNRPLELGQLSGPVLIFGGPYSNFAATMAMRQKAKELAIPTERIICTGDVVAYCAEPRETVQLVRDWQIAVVQGNCEESLGAEAPDFFAVFTAALPHCWRSCRWDPRFIIISAASMP